jgi:hypothetical protein
MCQGVLYSRTARWGYVIYVILIPYVTFPETWLVIHMHEKEQQDKHFLLIMNFNKFVLEMFRRSNFSSSGGVLYKQLYCIIRIDSTTRPLTRRIKFCIVQCVLAIIITYYLCFHCREWNKLGCLEVRETDAKLN